MKKTKLALFQSVVALLLCISMLAGTTFAWFTDSVTSGNNIIKSGKLDVTMEWFDGTKPVPAVDSDEWIDASTGAIFDYSLWEPGYTQVRHIKIENKGNLALKYQLHIQANGTVSKLSDVIDVYFLDPAKQVSARTELTEDKKVGTLTQVLAGMPGNASGSLKADEIDTVTIALKMQETAGNEYQNLSIGSDFKVILLATQEVYESDSFGSDYDKDAIFDFPENTISVNVTGDVAVENGAVKEGTTLDGGTASAVIPAGVQMAEGNSKLTLTISEMAKSGANLTLGENEAMRPLNVHVEGIAANNTIPMEIYIKEAMPKGLNMGNYKFYHVENGNTVEMTMVDTFTAHNQFKYDPATGDVTLYMATFSEVALVADTVNAWEGKFDYTWYDASKTELAIANADQLAAFGAIVGGMNGQTEDSFAGKTVKLISNVNLGYGVENHEYKTFYPIGYYNSTGSYKKTSGGSVTSSVSSFEGTFDGSGHTIKNFYQNTWEMFGDYNDGYSGTPNHYKDAMGLFGYVLNGIVKNLTVSNFSSDGEYTPTGVIAAYADGNSTFENIAITNCNPRVYNTGNGGIIGIAGDTSAANDDHITLKNITVDNSNKISALWGSWDVACGGLVGMYRGNVDGSGNPTDDTISFENCHVSAIIDVYNDVCANYQYYAYRYSGMIIGSVRHNTKNDDGKTIPDMTGISATGCTVNYGDWNDYYYCEFVKNTMASYSEDYQFSRVPHSELNFEDSNGNGVVDADERASVTGCKHEHTAEENHQAVYLPFHQLFTGYSWGVSSVGLEKYSGVVTNLDITEGDQEESVVKFNSAFPNAKVDEKTGVVTTDFLYRVGNQNTVAVGSLFEVLDAYAENSGHQLEVKKNTNVQVTIDKVDENSNVSGTFTANTTDWTKGTIQFSGTGVVKVTIQDYNFCTPTELYLEVVDAKNITKVEDATANNVVLLNSVENGGFSVSAPYGFYGNGFTITLNPSSHSLKKGNGYAGYIHMNGGTIDNVRIEGPVFAMTNIYQSQGLPSGTTNADTTVKYFRNAICIDSGDARITNSYISGARAAICVKAGGNVMIENSHISGGAYTNIEVLAAKSLTLENVVTEQKSLKDSYGTNKDVIGLGIVINNADTELVLNGLTQYNWINETQWNTMLGSYSNQFPKLFTDSYTEIQYTYDGNEVVNAGIIWACKVSDPNVVGSVSGYGYHSISVVNVTGSVYTFTHTGNAPAITKAEFEAPDYAPNTQGAVPPKAIFDYDKNNVSDGDTSSKYDSATGKFVVAYAQGQSIEWDANILEVTKGNIALDYRVSVSNGPAINEDNIITFNAPGDYTVTYTYSDEINYRLNDGQIVTYKEEYQKTVIVTVSEVKPEVSASFTFGTGDEYSYKTEIANGLTYVMPNVAETVNSNTNGIRKTSIDGKDIYYPVVSMHKSGTSSWYNYFSVFDAVTIKDSNDNIYNESTKEMPTNLTVIGGFILDANGNVSTKESSNGTAIFNYSTGKEIKCKTYSNYGLCYYPDSQFTSTGTSDRAEQTIVVKYRFSENGKEYYYYVGYWCEKHTKSSTCVTPDTLITLANGSKVRVDSLTGNEELLVWNHETGKLDKAPVAYIVNHDAVVANHEVYHLNFSNGKTVKIIGEHVFFDTTLNKYVALDSNSADYIGHEFLGLAGNGVEKVKLVSVVKKTYKTSAYEVVSYKHLTCFTNDMLSTSAYLDQLLNVFDINTNTFAYDMQSVARDIETYGLYTYADFEGLISEEAFELYNAKYLKIAIGKGYITWEDILDLIDIYFNVDVQPIQ